MMAWSVLPRSLGGALAFVILLAFTGASLASDRGFPFGRALFLDAPPIGKSRRIPNLEVATDGQATIDLWCASGSGQVTVSGDTIAIAVGPMVETQCTPERLRADDELREALAAVTAWRRDGNAVVLSGAKTLRYLLETH
jgi:heat shock protein HslJ